MPAGTKIVAVIDDDPAVRTGIQRLLQACGYETAAFASAADFLADADTLAPNCVIADLAMPGLSGLELQDALIARNARFPLIFVTGQGDLRASVTAMRHGAVDFLEKPFASEELLGAVERAIARDRRQREDLDSIRQISEMLASLTRREREVFDGVVAGMLNKQIAGQLRITEKTVKVHRARVMQKMGVRSVAQLARIAEKLDLRQTG